VRRTDPGPDQSALFAPVPAPEQQRAAGDPHIYLPANPCDTQVQAAARALPNSARQRGRVLLRIQRAGPVHLDGEGRPTGGLTDEEIGRAAGLDGNSVRPRRKELESVGLIVPSGHKRPTRSGSKAIVWVVAEGVA